ncbi:EF-hand domain-containing protein 1 [Parasteatoda tepidariorum]|uniref:EF-hand domain-containing protein 1 n=1 Tax=Parasteatoda tepidariorum TaxID=114398 RepID=UPI001C718293|nr:EF-hand domain-containing protein 1 [Parasteatoda tepidariorum]
MSQSLPLIPGYSFRDLLKDRYVFPSTLVYSKGVPLSKSSLSSTSETAAALLEAQNKTLDRETLTRLTYGPKRTETTEIKLPKYLAMDKKVLRFVGYLREEVDDWSREKYRIRPVHVLYYLQNDTMEVIEPKIANSGLVQGTLLKRQVFPHPKGRGRRYLWKDLNIGIDVRVFGISIHLTDCDEWTREYLIDAGLELNEPESIPPDPYIEQKINAQGRHEVISRDIDNDKLYKFLVNDRKVLRFYGIWKDLLNEPPDMRRVIVQYYLADDTMELLENHAPNNGRLPLKTVVKKQKIPIDRDKLSENFPLGYLEIKDDDLTYFDPKDLRTGKDITILGKNIFLYDCDDFTRYFYKVQYGIDDMQSIRVAEKPKPPVPVIYPPHTGIGGWEDSLQNCLSIVPKPPRKDFKKEEHYSGIALRYKAKLITSIKEDISREFVITFFPSDDTVTINEEAIPNSGFPGGAFLKRNKLPKQHSSSSAQPTYYKANDFFIGAEIRAAGKFFKLMDADKFVLAFMEQHPEIYTEEQIESHRKILNLSKQVLGLESEKNEFMKKNVIENYGSTPYPLPNCLYPASDVQQKEIIKDECHCSGMPVEQVF